MNNVNILYFTRSMGLGGTEKVILQLCEIMKKESNKIVVCSCGGVNVGKLNEMGIKHYDIPDIELKDLKTVLTTLKTVCKIIKDEDINIVHTHHRMAAFYTKLLRINRKFIFVHNAHNTFNDKKRLTKFALKNAHNIAVGNKVEENLCDFYKIPKSNVDTIYNGIKPLERAVQPIELLEKYREDGYFLIGNIGRLSEQKGMEYFVKAVPLVMEKVSKVKFFIAGDGEEKEKIQKLITYLHLEEDVILLGYINDIQNLMSQLDLIVLSSLWEGLPLTPIEAFSVGKTVVATAVDGTVEIIDDNVNGILVQPKDSKQIADAIIKIHNDPNGMVDFKNNALKKYKEKFSYEVLKYKYIEYYKKLME